MYKIFLLFYLLLSVNFYSQLTLTIEEINKKKGEIDLKITFFNDSNETYILPIDTTGFKTYMEENGLNDFFLIRNYPDLGLIPLILNDNAPINSMVENKGTLQANNIFIKKEKQYQKNQNRILNKWRKKYNLSTLSDKDVAVNHYLFNNLLIIRPFEKITYQKKIDFQKINEKSTVYTYYSYPLQHDIKYKMFLKIYIDNSIYNYLTKNQKEKFFNYTFFEGELKSNTLDFEFRNNK